MRILLVPNPSNPRSADATRAVLTRLTGLGYEPFLDAADADACDLPEAGVARADIGSPELAVALGGDGTILKAVHLLGPSDVPVLGVNLGRLGFLAGAEADGLEAALDAALAGEASVERRQTVEADVFAGGRPAGRYRALNEVYIGRGVTARGVELDVSVNGTWLMRLLCDGLVVATPTGSTAYALSAGGPIVAPNVRGMVVVPVAPHTLTARPIVVGAGDVVRIEPIQPPRSAACVSVDGDQVPCRSGLDAVEVRIGEHDVRLLKLDGRDFYEVASATFLGGSRAL